jgi:hypothetical protein
MFAVPARRSIAPLPVSLLAPAAGRRTLRNLAPGAADKSGSTVAVRSAPTVAVPTVLTDARRAIPAGQEAPMI